jgi:rubrerythrin
MAQFVDPKAVLPTRMSHGAVIRAIRQALAAEEEATSLYETIAESTDDSKVQTVLHSIADEERVHVGELHAVLNYLTGDEDELFLEGIQEANDDMDNSETPEDIEERVARIAKSMTAASRHADAAKAVRAVLKKKFPSIKFSVRSESFAGGNAVNVRWVDGPTTKDVDDVAKDYQSGHFDGMRDLYEYSNVNNELPQVKYVDTQREMSQAVRKKIEEEISKKYNIDIEDYKAVRNLFDAPIDTVVYRIFNQNTY